MCVCVLCDGCVRPLLKTVGISYLVLTKFLHDRRSQIARTHTHTHTEKYIVYIL